MRINKYLSEHGYCSRREADALIRAGSVFVNRKRAMLGDQVEETDRVEVIGRAPKAATERTYLLLHKPAGYATTTNRYGKKTAMDLVPKKSRLLPVGQLGTNASGVLLMTNDGNLIQKLSRSRAERDVEYEATLDKPIGDAHLRVLAEGIVIDGQKTVPAAVRRMDGRTFSITLSEESSRQIRRMCDELGYTVSSLARVRAMGLRIGTLAEGTHRELTPTELSALKRE